MKYFLEEEIQQWFTLSFLAPKIWELIAQPLKYETKLSQFKTNIKVWTTSQCLYRMCKKYISHIEFIEVVPMQWFYHPYNSCDACVVYLFME